LQYINIKINFGIFSLNLKKFFLHPSSPHKIRVSEKPTLPIVPELGKNGTIAPFINSTKYDKMLIRVHLRALPRGLL